jgi:hypothetical protein
MSERMSDALAAQMITGQLSGPEAEPAPEPTEAEPARLANGMTVDEVKGAADAMGVLIRSGVRDTNAAAQVGLEGLEFTGALPTSLRLPVEEAEGLEGASGPPAPEAGDAGAEQQGTPTPDQGGGPPAGADQNG